MQFDRAVAQLAQSSQTFLRVNGQPEKRQDAFQLRLERLVQAIHRAAAWRHQTPQRNERVANQTDLANGAAGLTARDVLDRDRRHRPEERAAVPDTAPAPPPATASAAPPPVRLHA